MTCPIKANSEVGGNLSLGVCAKSLHSVQLLVTCDHTGLNPPTSSVHGMLQARILGGLPFPPPGNLPDPGSNPFLLCCMHWHVVSLPPVPQKPQLLFIILQ